MREFFSLIRIMVRNLLIKIMSYFVIALSHIFLGRGKRNIWLIACGGGRWGDNADALWQYLNINHPEINAYAVVKNKKDLYTMRYRSVKRNSLRNFMLVIRAKAIATTHNLADFGPLDLVRKSGAKKIWLQHGVIGIKTIDASNYNTSGFDLICASSTKEKEIMVQELGINPNLISITGLARHDRLKCYQHSKESNNCILYIPTKRDWVTKEEREFYDTHLFSWVNRLVKYDQKITIMLWLHPGWYRNKLGDLGSDSVIKYDFSVDPQELLKESNLLITDYSSIFFDVALSGKPTIFYQPDKANYIKNNGLLQGFLEQNDLLVVEKDDDLIAEAKKIFTNRDYYEERAKKDKAWALMYVETYDGNSCLRIHQKISELVQGEL